MEVGFSLLQLDEFCSLKTLKSLMTLTTLKNEKSVADLTTDFSWSGYQDCAVISAGFVIIRNRSQNAVSARFTIFPHSFHFIRCR